MGDLINCGSGQRKFQPPWINVDINPRWEPDILGDVKSIPQLEDNCAATVVFHHSIEHLTLTDSAAAFKEAHRLLRPGGSMIVCVPNLRALVDAWREGRIDDYIFCVNLHGAYMNDEADLHRWSFTYSTLKKHIENAAKWRRIDFFNNRPIAGADIAQDWWILSVEAVK
jgi:predicted SAM-dependent methyltransferase